MTKNVTTTNIYHNNLSDYTSTDIYATDTISISSITGATGTTGTSYSWPGGQVASPIDWSNLSVTSGSGTGLWTSPSTINQSGSLDLRGENADVKVNGRSLMDAIDALEQRLNILVPNPELEKEWDELRELGDRYRELEKKCKEKGEMWKKLKQMPPPEVK